MARLQNQIIRFAIMNLRRSLRPVSCVCLFLVCTAAAIAQSTHYIYIQSEQRSPFYVRMGQQTFSSSAFGHLILSGLKDSTYFVHIGFPRQQGQEHQFRIALNRKDRGFELKRNSSGNIILYDWHSEQSLLPAAAKETQSSAGAAVRSDTYSKLMAAVVNDSAVLFKTIASVEPEPVSDTVNVVAVAEVSSIDSAAIVPDSTVMAKEVSVSDSSSVAESRVVPDSARSDTLFAATEMTVIDSSAIVSPDVTSVASADSMETSASVLPGWKLSESASDSAWHYVFVDRGASGGDTVVVVIDKEFEPAARTVEQEPVRHDSASAPKLVMMNSDCQKFASENDLDRLRLAVLREATQEDRIEVSKKTFRTMCFTTKHILALSELFLTDEYRFNFFSAAYPFVSDSGNFRTLLNQLSDPVYVEKFRTMVRM